jgi:beta-lactamase superfamily II metal-dependent hydrolase
MNVRFIAIGVAQGDAFFLECPEVFTVLIDGGRSVGGFASQFQRVTERDRVDVLVCTHNDADHANGIIGFLQSGLGCTEV